MNTGIELEDEPRHHELFWKLQKVGWIGMLVVILTALSGVFGSGPLARAESGANGVRLRYPRFGRMTTTERLDLTVQPPHTRDKVSVRIPRHYLQKFEVTAVLPEPESLVVAGDQFVYTFVVEPSLPLHISLRLKVQEGSFGRVLDSVQTSKGKLDFWQFFWP